MKDVDLRSRMSPTLPCVVGVVLGVVCGWVWPWRIGLTRYVLPSGVFLGVLVALLTASLLHSFKRHRTSSDPRREVTAIVDTGLYRFSRNPGYVGAGAVQVVVGLLLNNAWIVLMVIPAMVVIHRWVVLGEEAHLEAKFGEEYLKYKARVRRWI